MGNSKKVDAKERDDQSILVQAQSHRPTRAATQQTRLSRERLVELGQAQAYLVHELRRPVVTAGLLAKAMHKRGKLNSKHAQSIEAIIEQLTDCEALLRDCLDFVGPTKGKRSAVDAFELARGVRRSLLHESRSAGVQIELQGEPGECPVWGVHKKLRQALVNVIHNAVEAVQNTGGTVTLACKASELEVAISVQDTGPGMDRDMVKRIFQPFFSTKEHGTGLGLALANKIVRDHDGRLMVRSKPGKGTRFTIRLPSSDSQTHTTQ